MDGEKQGDEVGRCMAKAGEVAQAGKAEGNAKVAVVGVGGDGRNGYKVGRSGTIGEHELLGGDVGVLDLGELRIGKNGPDVAVVEQRGIEDGVENGVAV